MLKESIMAAMHLSSQRVRSAIAEEDLPGAAYHARQITAIEEIDVLIAQTLQKYAVSDIAGPSTIEEISRLGHKKLSKRNKSILRYCIAHQNKDITYQELYDHFWPQKQSKKSVDNAMAIVRSVIEEFDSRVLLESINGVGFRYVNLP